MNKVNLLLRAIDEVWGQKEGWIEAASTILADVSGEEAQWRPSADVHSILAIVNHIAYWTEYGARLLHSRPTDDMLPFPEDGEAPAQMPADWTSARENLLKQHGDFRAGVAQLSDENLDYQHPGLGRSVGETIAAMIEHDAYHFGQIFILRQLWKSKS